MMNSRILLVEDDIELRDTLRDILEVAGYNCDFAEDSEEALNYIVNYKYTYNLIISDYLMPGISGLELYKKIKLNEIYKNVPFVIFSARNDEEIIMKCKEEGVTEFLKKPFEIASLINLIERYY